MPGFDIFSLYWIIAFVVAVLVAANGGFEFRVSASGSFSGALMVLGTFSLFYLLARII
jgi:hypothetical protein